MVGNKRRIKIMGLSGITAGQARFALLKQSAAPPLFFFGEGAEYGCGDI